jgi:hypothetical protein
MGTRYSTTLGNKKNLAKALNRSAKVGADDIKPGKDERG